MTQIQFHETYMGAQFYRKTLPELVKQLARIADALEAAQHKEAESSAAPTGKKGPEGRESPGT